MDTNVLLHTFLFNTLYCRIFSTQTFHLNQKFYFDHFSLQQQFCCSLISKLSPHLYVSLLLQFPYPYTLKKGKTTKYFSPYQEFWFRASHVQMFLTKGCKLPVVSFHLLFQFLTLIGTFTLIIHKYTHMDSITLLF